MGDNSAPLSHLSTTTHGRDSTPPRQITTRDSCVATKLTHLSVRTLTSSMSDEVPPQQQHDSNGRRYRSKKQRPCDVCRSRKIQCKLHGNEVVCEMCKKLGRRCTYVLGPLRRKHRGSSANGDCRDSRSDLGPAFLEAQQQQEGSSTAAMAQAQAQARGGGGGDSHMAMDVDPFWLGPQVQHLPTSTDMQWSPRGSTDLLGMNWPAMQGPLGMSAEELPDLGLSKLTRCRPDTKRWWPRALHDA